MNRHMKRIPLLAAAIVLLGAGCAYAPGPSTDGAAGTQLEGTPAVDDTPGGRLMAPKDAADATYLIDGEPVTLRAGVAETAAAPDSEAVIVTRLFGEPVRADLDADGDMDAAVMLERSGPGTGRFYYVAAALTETGYVQGTEAFLLGDRVAPQTLEFRGGLIIANYADRKPGEPMTAQPSMGASVYFRIEKGALVRAQP